MAERGKYKANRRADDRRSRSAVTSHVKDSDGAGPRLYSAVFKNRSKSERMMGNGGGTLSGANGKGKKTF